MNHPFRTMSARRLVFLIEKLGVILLVIGVLIGFAAMSGRVTELRGQEVNYLVYGVVVAGLFCAALFFLIVLRKACRELSSRL